MEITFANPKILWLLVGLIPLVANYIYQLRRGGVSIQISSLEMLKGAPRTVRYYLRHLPFVLRCTALGLMVVVMARPQSAEHHRRTNSEGIDIVMALDVSSSMLARDFEPDRITAAKRVAGSFISDRYGDRIGLVVFAGEAYTQSPLTTDQSSLQTLLSRVRSGVIEDGTAIGNGLATALNRLRESDAKSKVVILLTDGVNNAGEIAPISAAEIAAQMGVKLYTIGVGTQGRAPYPRADRYGRIVDYVDMKVEIDEKMLTEIAEKTGGKYFRATDNKKLEAIYDQINTLEKSKVEVLEQTTHNEEFLPWLLAAMALIAIEQLIKLLILKRLP